MSHRVYVQPEVADPDETLATALAPEPFIELEDESAEALAQSGGHLVVAISASGPSAYFNSLQLNALLDEIRAAAVPAARPVQRNLNDVADFIDEHTRKGALERYVSFLA